MKFHLPQDFCMRLAELEGDETVEAGCINSLNVGPDRNVKLEEETIVRKIAFGRFVEMKRRDLGMSLEQLAERAGVDTEEILSMEQDLSYHPEPSAITHLADVFKVSRQNLSQLAGLTQAKNERFIRETTKFAARSESSDKLTDQERIILEHYASILAEDWERD